MWGRFFPGKSGQIRIYWTSEFNASGRFALGTNSNKIRTPVLGAGGTPPSADEWRVPEIKAKKGIAVKSER